MLLLPTPRLRTLLPVIVLSLSAAPLVAQKPDQAVIKAAIDSAKDSKTDPLGVHPSILEAQEYEKRTKVLADPKWKQVDAEFQKWLTTQVIYSPSEVERMNRRLIAERNEMSSDELQDFLNDWDSKLKLLLGKDGAEAQQWLGVYMANMADGYRGAYLKRMGLANPGTLTAAQLEEGIVRIRANQKNLTQYQASYQHSSDQRLLAAQQQKGAAAQEKRLEWEKNSDSGYNGYSNGGFQSIYSPCSPPQTRIDLGYGFRGW